MSQEAICPYLREQSFSQETYMDALVVGTQTLRKQSHRRQQVPARAAPWTGHYQKHGELVKNVIFCPPASTWLIQCGSGVALWPLAICVLLSFWCRQSQSHIFRNAGLVAREVLWDKSNRPFSNCWLCSVAPGRGKCNPLLFSLPGKSGGRVRTYAWMEKLEKLVLKSPGVQCGPNLSFRKSRS